MESIQGLLVSGWSSDVWHKGKWRKVHLFQSNKIIPVLIIIVHVKSNQDQNFINILHQKFSCEKNGKIDFEF